MRAWNPMALQVPELQHREELLLKRALEELPSRQGRVHLKGRVDRLVVAAAHFRGRAQGPLGRCGQRLRGFPEDPIAVGGRALLLVSHSWQPLHLEGGREAGTTLVEAREGLQTALRDLRHAIFGPYQQVCTARADHT